MPRLKGRVLFIGEDDYLSALVAKIINRAGCQTDSVCRSAAVPLLSREHYDYVLLDWVTDEDREPSFYQQVCALAPQSHVYLFTGMSSGQEVILGLNDAREEELSLLNFRSLIAAVDPTTLPLLEKMGNSVAVGGG